MAILVAASVLGLGFIIWFGSQRRPFVPTPILYKPEEVLKLPWPRSSHDYRFIAPLNESFVIFMGAAGSAVRITIYNCTLINSQDNSTDVYLSLRAENLGTYPVCVFHSNDIWVLITTGYAFQYEEQSKPLLILQPLQSGQKSLKFSINSSLEPAWLVWCIWTGAGWSRYEIVVSIRGEM